MAMLAEKRRKCKFVLTPVAKPLWTLESSQFGKKMMEKMGWAAGKGLGATEQGIHEPLRAVYKQDSKGMGYSGQGDPFENLDQFNALLASLSGETPAEDVVHSFESLEEKSKHSRSRVHYKKFTRGKDISRYSNVDLSCIVGTGKKVEEEYVEPEEIDHTGEEEHSHGVTTINSGSIADYFLLKMKQKTYLPETVSDNEFTLKDDVREGISGEVFQIENSHKKSKKKRKNQDNLEIMEDNVKDDTKDEGYSEDQQNIADCEQFPVKAKKRKKDNEKQSDDIEEENCDKDDKLEIKKKSKKKKKSKETLEDDGISTINMIGDDSLENKKTHKSKRRKEKDENSLIEAAENIDTGGENSSLMELDGSQLKKKKKKHHKEKKEKVIDNTDSLESTSENIEYKPKKKRKKDKIKEEYNNCIENEETIDYYNNKSEKKKKRKETKVKEFEDNKEIENTDKACEYGSENDDKKDNDLEKQTKENNENRYKAVVQHSDEILAQFNGSNLGSLPGYGHRRPNRTGH